MHVVFPVGGGELLRKGWAEHLVERDDFAQLAEPGPGDVTAPALTHARVEAPLGHEHRPHYVPSCSPRVAKVKTRNSWRSPGCCFWAKAPPVYSRTVRSQKASPARWASETRTTQCPGSRFQRRNAA